MMSEYAALIGTGLLILSAGAGFLLKRWITGRHHAEDAESLEQVIRIKKLLEAEGISLEEAKALRREYRKGSGGLAQAEAKALVAKQVEAENRSADQLSLTADWDGGKGSSGISFYDTTMGMKIRLARELDVRETELKHLLAELERECSESRAEYLRRAQAAWEAFRNEEASFQGALFEGGTGQPVLGLSRTIQLTEERIREIRIAIEESRI